MNLIEQLRAKLATLTEARNTLVSGTTAADFTEERAAQIAERDTEIDTLSARIDELVKAEERQAEFARRSPAIVTHEPNPVYRKGDASASFFRDLAFAGAADSRGIDARARLAASQETRALSTTAGAGGQFAPPLWLIEDFVALALAGRVAADMFTHDNLPSGVSSVNLPTVASGTATAVQSSQNSALQSTDLTTSSVSSGISTIGGTQTVSLQLLNQSGIPIDRVILQDLARHYAINIDTQVLYGTGSSGQLQGVTTMAGSNAITYTQASPTVVGAGQFYSQILQAIAAVAANLFLPPTAILMHPRRWYWVLDAYDTQNRPLVVPNGPAFNQPAVHDGTAVQGAAGTLAGLPVFLDPNIPINLGAGTNQDEVIVGRFEEGWLYESAVQSESFDATYANQASILYRVLGYSAFIPNRYPKAFSVINGTGLVTPVM